MGMLSETPTKPEPNRINGDRNQIKNYKNPNNFYISKLEKSKPNQDRTQNQMDAEFFEYIKNINYF